MILKRIHNFDQVMPFKEAVIQLNKEFDNIYHCLQIVFGIFNKLDEQNHIYNVSNPAQGAYKREGKSTL